MEANWKKKGFIISKLFSCLLEWLMVIDPMILSETELCQLVFDVIEYALHITSVCINSVMDIKYTSKKKNSPTTVYRKEDPKNCSLILQICDQRTGGRKKCRSNSSCSQKRGRQSIKSMRTLLLQESLKVTRATSKYTSIVSVVAYRMQI